jgi:hypothetical protein
MDDGSVDRDAACVAEAVPALPIALDMYLILDRSGSMSPDCNVGSATNSRWCYAINALAGFFAAPTSNGLGVALGFSPHGTCTWTDSTHTAQTCCSVETECCRGDDDDDPEVPLAELPGSYGALFSKLNEQIPNGTTSPLEAALLGLTRYTTANKRSERQMIGVIVTDGNPNGCNPSVPYLAGILSNHRAETGQLTFVIGMTPENEKPTDKIKVNHEVLEQLAIAGGATPHTTHCAGGINPCSFYDVGAGESKAFVDALQQIQRSIVGCRFTMPTTDAGLVDPNTFAVEWSSATEATPIRLPRLNSRDDCGEGWYAEQGEFALCDKTCSLLQGNLQVRIDVLAGCLGS